MPDNYGYINARLRAMHGKFLTGKLDEAIQASSYSEFLRILSETDMGADLGEATAQHAGLAELDKAVSRNFYNTAQKVVGMADGTSGTDIGLLFTRYDLTNLKAVARGKLSNRNAEEIEGSLLPAGTLKPVTLSQLASAPDLTALQSVVGLTSSPLATAFRKAVTQLVTDNDLLVFEIALDQAYYAQAVTRTSSVTLKNYFKREIDATNILTAMKLKAQGRTDAIEVYFVPNGREVNQTRFSQIASGNGGLEGLNAFSSISQASSLSAVESGVRNTILAEAKRLYTADPLGAGVAIGFLKEKENEVALVRLIARGKYYNVPNETLRAEVNRGI